MSSTVAKLNLRPQERRLVAVVGLVVFLVVNVVWVWPHFGDWSLLNSKKEAARNTYERYLREMGRTNSYGVKLRELESMGQVVMPEEQGLDFIKRVDSEARSKGLYVITLAPRQSMTTQTNKFFEEQDAQLHSTSDNEQLINFLVGLTSTNSLIRVKDMMLKPADATVTKLDEAITLVASYQRKTPAKVQPAQAPSLSKTGMPKPPPPRTAASATNKTHVVSQGHATNKPAIRSRVTNQPAKKP